VRGFSERYTDEPAYLWDMVVAAVLAGRDLLGRYLKKWSESDCVSRCSLIVRDTLLAWVSFWGGRPSS